MALVVKNPPDNAGDARDAGSVHGSGRSPGGGHTTHSSILAWKLPWTEEAGGLQSMGLQRIRQACIPKTKDGSTKLGKVAQCLAHMIHQL